MRRLVTVFFLLFLAGVFPAEAAERQTPARAFFVSVIQEPPVLTSRDAIVKLVDYAKKSGVDTLFVQIYRENKAWFPSKVGDDTPYRECFKSLSEDPLKLLIKEAHASGIQVHAWLNLMSLGANREAPLLKKYGPEILTRNLEEKKSLEDYKVDDQFFLEPGDPRVSGELTEMVNEITVTYPELDGIQFDYIRYPDLHPVYGYTAANTERYKKATGLTAIQDDSTQWKNWKRAQVTDLLDRLIAKARSVHPGIQISTTGLMPYSRAYLEAFQDWRWWLATGKIDFVTLMCYAPTEQGFKKYISDAKKKSGNLKKVNIAVGAYRLLHEPGTFKRQFKTCEESSVRACVVFHYGSLLENPELAGGSHGLQPRNHVK